MRRRNWPVQMKRHRQDCRRNVILLYICCVLASLRLLSSSEVFAIRWFWWLYAIREFRFSWARIFSIMAANIRVNFQIYAWNFSHGALHKRLSYYDILTETVTSRSSCFICSRICSVVRISIVIGCILCLSKKPFGFRQTEQNHLKYHHFKWILNIEVSMLVLKRAIFRNQGRTDGTVLEKFIENWSKLW